MSAVPAAEPRRRRVRALPPDVLAVKLSRYEWMAAIVTRDTHQNVSDVRAIWESDHHPLITSSRAELVARIERMAEREEKAAILAQRDKLARKLAELGIPLESALAEPA